MVSSHITVNNALFAVPKNTELKRTEEDVRRSEAFLAEGERLSHIGTWGVNVASGDVLWSQEHFRIFDVDPRETKPSLELFWQKAHPEDRVRLQQLIEEAVQKKKDFASDFRIILSTGTTKHVHGTGHAVIDSSGSLEFIGTTTDITERKQAEEHLRDSELRFRTLADTAPVMIWMTGTDKLCCFFNKPWLVFTGRTMEQELGAGWTEGVHPEDLQRIFDVYLPAFEARCPFNMEYRLKRANGEYGWVMESGVARYTPQGAFSGYIGSCTDITERKRSEDELRRSEVALQNAYDEIKILKDQLYRENLALREEIDQASMFEEIVGTSPALQRVLSRVAKVAPTDSTVLITGETGTGKELVARAIHKHSQRAERAFVSVNCAATPSSLIASELFGHEKGAFTGAEQRRLGRFELAEGGTLFLDEVGELPAETQLALLRVLQEREFERVGGTQAISADVRVIAATNQDLQRAIVAGTFRMDLFYRLNVFPIEVPSLRERRDDIPMLVAYFIARYAGKTGKRIRSIEKATLELFQSYRWPGNIRELQNVVERSVILCDQDRFSVDESWLLRQSMPHPISPQPLTESLRNQEKEMIEHALVECKGRVAGPRGAATRLGIPQSTLANKIKTLGINKNRFNAS
jgi:PAS domain S-box-containing protein